MNMREMLLARIAGDDRPERRVPICLDRQAHAAWRAAEQAHREAIMSRPAGEDEQTRRKSLGAKDPVTAAKAELDLAEDRLRDVSVQVVVKALPEEVWAARMAAFRALAQDDPARRDSWSDVAACYAGVEDMDGNPVEFSLDEFEELFKGLSSGEANPIVMAVVNVNTELPDLPF